jgi:hypothetical protein
MITVEIIEVQTANSRFTKAGISYFYDSEVLNSSFMNLMKFSAEKPCLRQYPKPLAASVE